MRLDEVIQQPGQMERMQQESVLSRMRVSVPGKVIRYDKDSQCVDVQPVIRDSGSSELPQMLLSVPVWFPGAYSYVVKPGDECLVIFADMCIDAWWQSGEVSSPFTSRKHDLSDGFALVGIRSLPNSGKGKTLEEAFEEAGSSEEKADKVKNAVAGDFAGLDGDGNLTDSGKKPSDFLTEEDLDDIIVVQDTQPTNPASEIWFPETPPQSVQVPSYAEFSSLAEEVAGKYSKPSGGIPDTDLSSGVQTSLQKAETAYQKPSSGIPGTDIESGVIPDITGKADKVTGATNGHFAALDANGNLMDSGVGPTSLVKSQTFSGMTGTTGNLQLNTDVALPHVTVLTVEMDGTYMAIPFYANSSWYVKVMTRTATPATVVSTSVSGTVYYI